MVRFETIEGDEVKFGSNNFIEVAKKKAITDDGENEFISISRGFVSKTGERRYRNSIAVPVSGDVVTFIADKLKELSKGATATAKKPKKEEAKETEESEEEF
ncbi:MAG: hypothetical protein V1802_02955 [Candidatus Aenigmatarchaeota archaeon]